ncbi:antichymotrypsin-2 isoform X1 [Drosophila mojavensis]|uniref:antichymotrypsin-2 isoform X1 n=1 Tax=Drosophila mojavensis TaxID=7230 RepID=UPI0013EE8CF7|nr:antichymotrypsin-2 isoform X1 [Drosophila mojavensis]
MAKLCRYPLFVLLLTSFLQLILANLATTVVSTVLRRTKPLNFVMSPQLLIESIYPMYLGASGETLREITQFLQLRGKTKVQAVSDFERYRITIARYMNIAMGLFTSDKVPLYDEYKNMLNHLLKTDYQTVDFTKPTLAAKAINEWVANNTKNHITELITRIPPSAQLMIFGALYFSGTLWLPYLRDINYTFFSNLFDGDEYKYTVNATISRAYLPYYYIRAINSNIIAIPYTKGNLHLLILMPLVPNDLQSIEENLHKVKMADLKPPRGSTVLLELILPHFSIKTTQRYRNIFRYFNISGMLESSASLKPMAGHKKGVYLEDVTQKTEFTNKAAHSEAASGRIGWTGNRNMPCVYVRHPFIFLVKDDYNIYLAGRVGYL